MAYTNSQAIVARGITTTINGVKIAELIDDGIPIPQTDTDDIETTNQDSGDWKEYKQCRKDGGECEIKCQYVSGDPGQSALAAASNSPNPQLFITTFSDGSASTFYGVVKTFDVTVSDQKMMISSKVKVSGQPTFAGTDSALTGLTVTGQTLAPTFSASKFNYTCSVSTDVTSVTVVPVQGATGASIMVNGVTVASGGNGAVTIGAAGSVFDIAVAVKEASKTAKVYFIHVFRA